MNKIEALPDLPWTDYAAKEIARSPGLVEKSDFAWQVGDLFIAGWIYTSFVAAPWFWFALTENFRPIHLRWMKDMTKYLPVGAVSLVPCEEKTARKFAEFFEFQKTGTAVPFNDIEYFEYRRG